MGAAFPLSMSARPYRRSCWARTLTWDAVVNEALDGLDDVHSDVLGIDAGTGVLDVRGGRGRWCASGTRSSARATSKLRVSLTSVCVVVGLHARVRLGAAVVWARAAFAAPSRCTLAPCMCSILRACQRGRDE